MNFSFNAAASLVADDVRPRLFFGSDDIPSIRQGLNTVAGRKVWQLFVNRARTFAGVALAADDLPTMIAKWNTSWNNPGTQVVRSLVDIATLAVLDDDEQAFEVCRRILAVCPAAEEISLSSSQGRQRLGYSTGFYLAPVYDMISSRLTTAERKAFCDWAVESAITKTLDRIDPNIFFTPGGNIALSGFDSAFVTAMSLYGDRYAKLNPKTIQRLIAILEVALSGSIGPNGYPLEDIGYGTYVTAKLAFNVELAKRLGIADLTQTTPRYHQFGRAILHFTQPWGQHLSNTGDHGDDFGMREFILPRLAVDTNDPSLLWLWQTLCYNHGAIHPVNNNEILYGEAVIGKNRQVPATMPSLLFAPLLAKAKRPTDTTLPTAFLCRRRGLASFRSGWRDNDSLLIFDSSQRSDGAQGHHHDSAGHFSFSAIGEYFAIDTGRYNVSQSCHNVTLVNAEQQVNRDEWSQTTVEGRLTDYATDPFVDTAACDATPQYGAAVRKAERRVGLVKGPGAPAYAWVVDAINANDKIATFDWQMQCAPESRLALRRNGATVTGFRHGNLLDVHLFLPLFPGNKNSPNAHRIEKVFEDIGRPNALTYCGFNNPGEMEKKIASYGRPSQMIHGPVYERPRLVIRFNGWNGRSLGLLIPRLKGDKAPKITQLNSTTGTIAVQIAFTDVTDTIIVGFDHALLRANDVSEHGGWCVVRCRNSDGQIIRRTVGTGLV